MRTGQTDILKTWYLCLLLVQRLSVISITVGVRLLTQHSVSVCDDLHQQAQDDPPFMSGIITGDQSWVYGCDPETRRMSPTWHLIRQKRLKTKQRWTPLVSQSQLVMWLNTNVMDMVSHLDPDQRLSPPSITQDRRSSSCWIKQTNTEWVLMEQTCGSTVTFSLTKNIQ